MAWSVLWREGMNAKTIVPYSVRKLPAVHAAMIDLHRLVFEWLKPSRTPRSLTSQIYRSSRSAILALELAALGPRPDHHLRRAKERMLSCFGMFAMLRREGHITDGVCRDARRHIDRVLMGLDLIQAVPVDHWESVPLPPRPAASTEKATRSTAVSTSARVEVDLSTTGGIPPEFVTGVRGTVPIRSAEHASEDEGENADAPPSLRPARLNLAGPAREDAGDSPTSDGPPLEEQI
jgi:hypothetical protein